MSEIVSIFPSAEKRASPPGTSDCSGSHHFDVPLVLIVLMSPRALAPPMASAALLTRLCSLVGVAQESRNKAPKTAASAYLIVSSYRVGQEENTRPKGLFLQERAAAALKPLSPGSL